MILNTEFKEPNILEIEYDDEARDELIKAGLYPVIEKAIATDRIGQLEARVKYWRKKYRKLKKGK